MDFSLSTMFGKKESSVLGVDIGSSSIKAVQLKKKGNKAILETYGELALGPYAGVSVGQATKLPREKIIQALRDLLAEKEVKITTKNCGVAIPFHASLLTVISLPPIKEKDLENMIPIEARKYIPVPISEVTLDWSVIPKLEVKNWKSEVSDEIQENKNDKDKNQKSGVDVLLAAIHNNALSDYQKIIVEAELDPSFFEIELFSSIRSVLNEGETAMIIDVGAASTKLYVVERGVLRSSHIVNKGAQDMTANIARLNSISFEEAEIAKRTLGMSSVEGGINVKDAVNVISDQIFSEANRVLFSYQSKAKKNMEKVMLVGGGSTLRGWKELAAQNFNVEVVSGDPFSKVEAPAFLEDILRQTGPEFAVSLGVALRKLKEL